MNLAELGVNTHFAPTVDFQDSSMKMASRSALESKGREPGPLNALQFVGHEFLWSLSPGDGGFSAYREVGEGWMMMAYSVLQPQQLPGAAPMEARDATKSPFCGAQPGSASASASNTARGRAQGACVSDLGH